jgi:hypothetical protein
MTRSRDFFISYNGKDVHWAEWIAWTLSDAGYSHYFQKWDFRPGGNFVLDMQRAAADSHRTLIVLTASYLGALYTQPEWAAAFARDPTGEQRLVLPVRVEPCETAGMLRTIVYCDLVGLPADDARTRLLEALRPTGKPEAAPDFPGQAAAASPFPGPAAPARAPAAAAAAGDPLQAAARELRSVLDTSGTTFRAQARLRDDLARRIQVRLGITTHFEYEELFDRFFERLEPDELRLHRTMRAYTESILHDYNRRTLDLLERSPMLADALPSSGALRLHLILWLAKFKDVFLPTPSMCLLYVGVEEGVGFPRAIEAELDAFLRDGRAVP